MYNIYTTDFIVAPSDPDESIVEYMPLANMGLLLHVLFLPFQIKGMFMH